MTEPVGRLSGGDQISLKHLIALNDEIAALTRAGLPLERGLRDAGRDLNGTLSTSMLKLSDRLDRGESLSEALAANDPGFPPLYRAVVEAGLRAGRLPVALESLASFARSYDETRRAIGQAFLYPLIVMVLAYVLFLGMVTQMVPRFLEAFHSLEVTVPWSLQLLAAVGSKAIYWGPIFPSVLLILMLGWAWTGRASSFPSSGSFAPLRWLPWMGRMITQSESANFAQLLSILIEHGTPYHQAVRLASEASGDPFIIRAGREVAEAAERGELRTDMSGRGVHGIPPLLRWCLITASGQAGFAGSLYRIALVYRKRALHQAEKIRIFLPVILLIGIGATVTLLYALTFFVPLTELFQGVARPVN